MEPFWLQIDESELRQGDYLPGCTIPVFGPAFTVSSELHEIRTDQGDLIIVTQSCDLEQRKVRLVAGCPSFLSPNSRPSIPPSPERDDGMRS